MPSLKAIRTRIASVKSTQKITRAMKLVAAARLRRAQDAIIGARPYANALQDAVSEVALRASAESHELLDKRPVKTIGLVTLTSDRGLAGGFNANIFRAVQRFMTDKQATGVAEQASQTGALLSAEAEKVSLYVVGRKGRDHFRRRRLPIVRELAGAGGDSAEARAQELSLIVLQAFKTAEVDAVYLAYNQFKSAIQQKVVIEPVLPLTARVLAPRPEAAPGAVGGAIDFIYEPGQRELLDTLLPLYVESQIYRALLESIASEFGARMTAMDSATNNAKEVIGRLTLQYNRARQAAITKELMEIVSGAEALKG
jgi:F-type H+-transporting ATPase subunit gamma